MRIRSVCVAALVFGTIIHGRVIAQRRERAPEGPPRVVEHGWLSSLDEGMAAARKSGKPLMVVIRCVP